MDEPESYPIKQNVYPDATDRLIERAKGMSKRRGFRAWFIPCMITVAFTAAMLILGSTGYIESGWAILSVFIVTSGIGIWIWLALERQERLTVEALCACKELRTLGPLLNCLENGNGTIKRMVRAAVQNILPHLTVNDSGILETSQREALNSLLYSGSGELALAALYALEKVGDGTALPYLTSIAAGKGVPHTLRNRQAEVIERARRTVESIRERIERHNRASVLLRASQDPGTPSDQLVRPVMNKRLDTGEELLRPELSLEEVERENDR